MPRDGLARSQRRRGDVTAEPPTDGTPTTRPTAGGRSSAGTWRRWRGRLGRIGLSTGLSACLVVAGVAVPAGSVAADPSPSKAKKKLTKLNEDAQQLVEKYNQVNSQLKSAKRHLRVIDEQIDSEQKRFAQLRGRVAQMASAAYKSGDKQSVAMLMSANDPQTVLDRAAQFNHMSNTRGTEVRSYLASASRLERQRTQAKTARQNISTLNKKLRDRKNKVEKKIAKQKRILGTSTGSASGGTYNGPASGSARKALNFAYSKIGSPYCYGGAGPSCYDCSGLTMKAWGAAGVNLPHNTNAQYSATKKVSRSDLRPGDLVYFNNFGHMGMYVGGNKMIHAPRTGKNVEVVSMSGYYSSNFVGASRP